MKNTARNTLTAVTLAGLLGITACGTGTENASEQTAPSTQGTETSQASPSQEADNSAKPAGWSDSLETTLTVPAEWQGGAGWTAEIDDKPVLSIGDYIVYQEKVLNSSSPIIVVDGKGDKKETFEVTPSEFKEGDYSYLSADTATKDGKKYLVVIENGKSQGDPTSVAKVDGRKSIVTAFDETLKEVWTKTVPFDVNVVNDAVTIIDGKDTSDISNTLDVATGADVAIKTPAEHEWVGRFDGVDVFSKEPEDFMGPGTVTNGIWTAKYHEEAGVEVFGTKIAVERPQNLGHQKGCDLLDPHTGKALDISGPTGSCPEAKVTSPNRDVVYFTPEYVTSEGLPGIISLSTGKKFSISKDISFTPTAISDTGMVYGFSNHDKASFDLQKDKMPKKMLEVADAPIFVASNGVAVFNQGKFIVKK